MFPIIRSTSRLLARVALTTIVLALGGCGGGPTNPRSGYQDIPESWGPLVNVRPGECLDISGNYWDGSELERHPGDSASLAGILIDQELNRSDDVVKTTITSLNPAGLVHETQTHVGHVEVTPFKNNRITVRRIEKGKITKQKTLLKGKDFNCDDGKIKIETLDLAVFFLPLPIVGGIYKSSVELAKTQRNDLVAQFITTNIEFLAIVPVYSSVSKGWFLWRAMSPDRP